MNLSHSVCGSEIPENVFNPDEETRETEDFLQEETDEADLAREAILSCLEEASGESRTCEEIAEETDLEHAEVRRICKLLAREDESTRTIHQDVNRRGCFFWSAAIVDRINLSLE